MSLVWRLQLDDALRAAGGDQYRHVCLAGDWRGVWVEFEQRQPGLSDLGGNCFLGQCGGSAGAVNVMVPPAVPGITLRTPLQTASSSAMCPARRAVFSFEPDRCDDFHSRMSHYDFQWQRRGVNLTSPTVDINLVL